MIIRCKFGKDDAVTIT